MTDEPNETPKNFQGWTVQRSKDGFIRLYKSFKGKVERSKGIDKNSSEPGKADGRVILVSFL